MIGFTWQYRPWRIVLAKPRVAGIAHAGCWYLRTPRKSEWWTRLALPIICLPMNPQGRHAIDSVEWVPGKMLRALIRSECGPAGYR